MISHYAGIAEAEGVEMLSLNCELYCPNSQAERWRRVANATRVIYPSGLLTVSQIKGHEDEMKWWDAVDVIGIDATMVPVATPHWSSRTHGRLTSASRAISRGDTASAWRSQRWDTAADSAIETRRGFSQTRAPPYYAALFEAMRGEQDWFLGAFWWNWNTDDALLGGGLDTVSLVVETSRGRAAWYYRATAPAAAARQTSTLRRARPLHVLDRALQRIVFEP